MSSKTLDELDELLDNTIETVSNIVGCCNCISLMERLIEDNGRIDGLVLVLEHLEQFHSEHYPSSYCDEECDEPNFKFMGKLLKEQILPLVEM